MLSTARKMAITSACAVVLVAGVPSAALRAAEEAPAEAKATRPERQALVGQWRLNPDLSEDPQKKMREAVKKRMPGSGGRGGDMGRGGGGGGMGGGGVGRGGGGRGGRVGREGENQGRRPPMMAFFSAEELTITHISPAVAMVEPDGLVRTLQPDGEKYQVEHGEGEVETKWEGDRLAVETKTERGKMKETWGVDPETGRLMAKLELEPGGGRGPKVEVQRVYDPVER